MDQNIAKLHSLNEHNQRGIEVVEQMQTDIMETMRTMMNQFSKWELSLATQVPSLMSRVTQLEGQVRLQHDYIKGLEWKVEVGEESLLKCAKALELVSSRAYRCGESVVASGSGLREESELEYALTGEEEFRTPPPDLMTLVIEGGVQADQGRSGPWLLSQP